MFKVFQCSAIFFIQKVLGKCSVKMMGFFDENMGISKVFNIFLADSIESDRLKHGKSFEI
jgi:hypothetical protein